MIYQSPSSSAEQCKHTLSRARVDPQILVTASKQHAPVTAKLLEEPLYLAAHIFAQFVTICLCKALRTTTSGCGAESLLREKVADVCIIESGYGDGTQRLERCCRGLCVAYSREAL
eukprot:gnl/TRDRNA2_/TRDRNA2_93512_c0_seq1.p1 gnl/TRDRNA2_/TRDRNA2_93512_c0~~gnl/TRDRNA2_/TRDRNA2_93512_c0_seq1.p1  ORF type:complete len:116 (-),score=15.31 gnl/TRDRNA2_/TRDRNA2_93512_c0_seq1:112-459(-)